MPEQFSFSPIYSEDVVDRTDAEGAAPGGQQLPRFTSGGAQVTPSSAPPPDAQPTGDSEPLNLPEQGGVRKTGRRRVSTGWCGRSTRRPRSVTL